MYCYPDTKKVGSQVPTNAIQVLGLKAILLTLGGNIVGVALLHQAYDVLCNGVHETNHL